MCVLVCGYERVLGVCVLSVWGGEREYLLGDCASIELLVN